MSSSRYGGGGSAGGGSSNSKKKGPSGIARAIAATSGITTNGTSTTSSITTTNGISDITSSNDTINIAAIPISKRSSSELYSSNTSSELDNSSGGGAKRLPITRPDKIYNTYKQVPSDTRIITFSDIHGDIHSLIIALRDCAQVIRKKDDHQFDLENADSELDDLLNIDLEDIIYSSNYNYNTIGYLCDLGYEWCGENTQVVIVGDIIDPARGNPHDVAEMENPESPRYIEHKQEHAQHEYPQIEFKILLFINAIIDSAKIHSNFGTIHKLFGNHELMNVMRIKKLDQKLELDDYSFLNDLKHLYIQDMPRNVFFYYGFPGFMELMKHGCGVFLMINNKIFVHGQLSLQNGFLYPQIDQVNQDLNNLYQSALVLSISSIRQYDSLHTDQKFINFLEEQKKLEPILFKLQEHDSILWLREYGGTDNIASRIQNLEPLLGLNESFCDGISTTIGTFFQGSDILSRDVENIMHPNNIQIIIGHCIQSESTISNKQNTSFFTRDSLSNKFIEVLIPPAQSGLADVGTPFIFGMTMECPQNKELSIHKIYKVDVGSSRGFESYNTYERIIVNHNPIMKERKLLLSRTPSVLEFSGDNAMNVKIIKSKMKNIRIHQPRKAYENLIEQELSLNTELLTNLTKFEILPSEDKKIYTIQVSENIKLFEQKLEYCKKLLSLCLQPDSTNIDQAFLTDLTKFSNFDQARQDKYIINLQENIVNYEDTLEYLQKMLSLCSQPTDKIKSDLVEIRQKIKQINLLNISDPANTHYNKKYLKYKMKYLKLKYDK